MQQWHLTKKENPIKKRIRRQQPLSRMTQHFYINLAMPKFIPQLLPDDASQFPSLFKLRNIFNAFSFVILSKKGFPRKTIQDCERILKCFDSTKLQLASETIKINIVIARNQTRRNRLLKHRDSWQLSRRKSMMSPYTHIAIGVVSLHQECFALRLVGW